MGVPRQEEAWAIGCIGMPAIISAVADIVIAKYVMILFIFIIPKIVIIIFIALT
jgi:hypothetical protein